MKKFNKKQWAYFRLQNFWRNKRLAFGFLFTLLVILAVPVLAITAGIDMGDFVTSLGIFSSTGGALSFASMAAIGNIEDDSDWNSQANQIHYEVKLVETTTQVDSSAAFPFPNASREVADITLLAGQVPHTFASHNRPTYVSSGELNDYTIDPTKEIQIVLANAFREKVLDFCEQKSGGKFILFFRRVETTQWYMVGTLDQPLRFSSYEIKGDGEASVAICKFTNKSLRQYYKYVGALGSEAAVNVAADATELAITDNDRYQLPADNTVATALATISGVAEADYGRTITIYGGGGDDPTTIPDGASFTLAGGVTWTGNAGSKISFRILDNNSLFEITGSRVQTA
nr:hypothetical protein [uncultured Draconibacterium sp.]